MIEYVGTGNHYGGAIPGKSKEGILSLARSELPTGHRTPTYPATLMRLAKSALAKGSRQAAIRLS